MYLDSQIYEIATEMLQPVHEAFGEGLKQIVSAECKAGDAAVREARKLKKSGDKAGAKKKYQEAINHYTKVRANASKIEDENILDWVISLCVKPMFILIMQVVNADGNLKGLTRQSTIKVIDDCIRAVKSEMNSL